MNDSDTSISTLADSSDSAAIDLYAGMSRIRRFEEAVLDQWERGNVPGPLHLSLGQEAVAVGVCAALRGSDAILSTHRGHHHCLAKGASSERLFAELLGRVDGYSRGRGGSMHVAAPALGILGTNGVVGGGIPIAVGSAYAMQVQGRSDVTVCFFGEGASSTGALAEALNIASLWGLPLVFVCENNQYVELTPSSVHVAGSIWRRAAAYDVPSVHVDGNDVEAVLAAARAAVHLAREGGGPSFIEAETYRWMGHYAGDPAGYRPAGELDRWKARDPLLRARSSLLTRDVELVDKSVEEEISHAVSYALGSDPAPIATLGLDHYAP